MTMTVRIPTPLRPMTGGKDEIPLEGSTVREVLDNLSRSCEGIDSRIRTESGEVRRFVNLFLNEEDIRALDGLETGVKDGDVLAIVPAIAGGHTSP